MVAKSMWVVSRGSYSDYRVMAICDSKERAEKAAKLLEYGEGFAEELIYLDHDPKRYTVHEISENLWDNGATTQHQESQRTEWEHDLLFPERLRPVGWRWVRAPVHHNEGGRLEVYGTSLTRVQKVFSDKSAEIRATDTLRLRSEAHS